MNDLNTSRQLRLKARNRGFSLIELMIVILIMGVLMGIVGFNLVGQAEKAKISATKTTMNTVADALRQYKVEYNRYPPHMDPGLRVLVTERLIEGIEDSWDQELYYFAPGPNGEPYELGSNGPDQEYGTADDIVMYPTDEGTPQPR